MNFYRCVTFSKQEDILILENPRFIYCINSVNDKDYKDIASTDNQLIVVDSQKLDLNLSHKHEKRNKSHLKLENLNDNKKNKTKFKKKVRSKINIDNEELLIVTKSSDKFTESSLEKNFTRHLKNSKAKKKAKIRSNTSFTIDENHESNIADKKIVIDGPISIKNLAYKLQIPETEIITGLFLRGISVTINQFVDLSIAKQLARHYSFEVLSSYNISKDYSNKRFLGDKNISKRSDDYIIRPAVITILGHVDHGKTTLLDAIRSTNMADKEIGGITQSIQAYEVNWMYKSNQQKVVLIDTPGHEAFISMRLRGAQATDLAILVVAADDGLKPQTIEAINHIRDNHLDCIIAINKIDKRDVNIQKIKEELLNYDLVCQDWGGEIPCIELSALKKKNIDGLMDQICNTVITKQLKASIQANAEGLILESYLDKTKGPIASVLVQNGILNKSDIVVSGSVYGRVKALIDFNEQIVQHVYPSSVVQILGFSSMPQAGTKFNVVLDDKHAKTLINQHGMLENNMNMFKSLNNRVTSYTSSKQNMLAKQINIIIKTDTQGSLEALIYSLSQIPQNKIQLNILFASSGIISDTDVSLAVTSGSIILAFNTSISLSLLNSIKRLSIIFYTSTVIYDVLDFVRNYMISWVEPEYDKSFIGTALVQTVFEINKGTVAGCKVQSGKMQRYSFIAIQRLSKIIYEGRLDSLKHIKDDVEEVLLDNECGVMCYNYNAWQVGDIIEAYQMNEKAKSLS